MSKHADESSTLVGRRPFLREASKASPVFTCLFAGLILVGMPVQALADLLVTSAGERVTGILANRTAVLDIGTLPPTVSILVGTGDDADLRRFSREDVDYVIVTEGGIDHVLDGRTTRVEAGTGRGSVSDVRANPKTVGSVLMILGVGVGAFSLALPQGGPKATVTQSTIDVDEKSYNAVNFVGMVLGGLLFLSGAVQVRGASSSSETAANGIGIDARGRLVWSATF